MASERELVTITSMLNAHPMMAREREIGKEGRDVIFGVRAGGLDTPGPGLG